jgi:hypothetical protein
MVYRLTFGRTAWICLTDIGATLPMRTFSTVWVLPIFFPSTMAKRVSRSM